MVLSKRIVIIMRTIIIRIVIDADGLLVSRDGEDVI